MYKGKTISAIIQARMGSTRLPGKVMKFLGNKKALGHVVSRINKSQFIDEVIVATSKKERDNLIKNWCEGNNVKYFTGPEENVLERFYVCLNRYPADIICRITADCPLIDYKLVDKLISFLIDNDYDYVSMNTDEIPRGVHGEVLTRQTLEEVYNKAFKKSHFEHVTYYIYENQRDEFNYTYLKPPQWLRRDYRLTLDTEEDLELFKNIFKYFIREEDYIELEDVIYYLDNNPEIAKINQSVVQKLPND